MVKKFVFRMLHMLRLKEKYFRGRDAREGFKVAPGFALFINQGKSLE
jgi:hypothetical protein